METKVSYVVVGAFVLLLGAAGVAGLLWLGSGGAARKEYRTYLAYFDESVSGLSVHAPVKYRGVEVGLVREIGLDAADSERVKVVLDIEAAAPVKEDTVAVLGVQGLTGIAYLELGGGSRDSPRLQARPGEPYPVIRTGPSLLRRLDTAATTLLASLDRTANRVNDVLDDRTRAELRGVVSDLRSLTRALARRSGDVDAALAAAARTAENTAQASAELKGMVARIERSAEAVERMADQMARAGESARAAFDGARGAVESAGAGARRFSGESLPELERLVVEMRETAAALGRVGAELERNPNALIMGRPALAPGPGE
ncbi:MAG TPA: MlaD family protein [Anaeromyxobacteraceae bacterium]|nr:MlaD family protein [Anaeromyxobacteraceae bacterium]